MIQTRNAFIAAGLLAVAVGSARDVVVPTARVACAGDPSAQGTPTLAIVLAGATGCDAPRQTVEFGSVPQGSRVERELFLTNPRSKAVVIDRFKASCDCVELKGLPLFVPADGRVPVVSVMDLSHEAEFHGGLCVALSIYDGSSRVGDANLRAVVSETSRPSRGSLVSRESQRAVGGEGTGVAGNVVTDVLQRAD